MSKPVILCVDDEVVVLDSLKIQLKKAFDNNYYFEGAESANEALELIEELRDEDRDIIVIVSDWLMPGLNGDEFLSLVHAKFPKVVKIMLTGQADPEAIERAKVRANLHCCLPKPWDARELIAAINTGVAKIYK